MVENNDKYIRVNKSKARKAYANGDVIRVTHCKCRPDNKQGIWVDWMAISDENDLDYDYKSGKTDTIRKLDREWLFNNKCTRWTYYNGNFELGYYPAFYLKKGE